MKPINNVSKNNGFFLVKDKETKEEFSVRAAENVVRLEIGGEMVKIFPQVLKLFVKAGQPFDGQTLQGKRPMVRMR